MAHILWKHAKATKSFRNMMEIPTIKLDDLLKTRAINQVSQTLIQIRDEITENYLEFYYHKYNKEKGVKELKGLLKKRLISVWQSRFLFIFLGFSLCLLAIIITMAADGSINPDEDETFKHIFPMFRGSAFLVLYIWFLGWNVYTWTKHGINYKKIFGFNHHFSTPTEILMRGTFFTLILLITFIWYVVVKENMGSLASGLDHIGIPKEFLPLIIWGSLIIYMFFPSRTWFNGEGRRYFFVRMYRYFVSPVVTIDVATGWVADQLMSFVVPLQDLAYTLCYYISRMRDYDNYHPSGCFSDTLYAGFLVGFFPGVFRTIHFLHFVYIAQNKIRVKRKELKEMERKTRNYMNNEEDKKKDLKLASNSINHLSQNYGIHKDSEKEVSNFCDKTTNSENDRPFIIIPQLKNNDSQRKTSSQYESALKEIQTLKDSRLLNFMYAIEQSLAASVTLFSFLFGSYPDSSLFFGLWLAVSLALSTYAYYMDVVKDWQLFQDRSKHPFLREKLMYSNKAYYYLAIIFDFFLRWVWIFSISPGTSSKVMQPEFFIFLMGGLEMFRRVIWNFLIVEKIFIVNIDSYKCLYEYELPLSQEEVHGMKIQGQAKGSLDKKKSKFSALQSLDYEEDFKARFGMKKRENDLRKKLIDGNDMDQLEVRIDEIEIRGGQEGHKEEEGKEDNDKNSTLKKSLAEKLQDDLSKTQEFIDAFTPLKSKLKAYDFVLHQRFSIHSDSDT